MLCPLSSTPSFSPLVGPLVVHQHTIQSAVGWFLGCCLPFLAKDRILCSGGGSQNLPWCSTTSFFGLGSGPDNTSPWWCACSPDGLSAMGRRPSACGWGQQYLHALQLLLHFCAFAPTLH